MQPGVWTRVMIEAFSDFFLVLGIGLGLGWWLGRLFPKEAERLGARREVTPTSLPGQSDREPLGHVLVRIGDELDANEAGSLADPHDILGNPDFEEGVSMLADPDVPLSQVAGYALGTHWVVGIMASEALARREDSQPAIERVLANIGQLAQWPLFFRLRFLAARTDRPVIGPVLVAVEKWWEKQPVSVSAVDEFVEKRVEAGEDLSFGESLDGITQESLNEVQSFVERLDPARSDPLLREISDYRDQMLDPGFVRSAGRLWSADTARPRVFQTSHVSGHLGSMRDAFQEDPPRSILLVGEPGVGKTSLRMAFAEELSGEGWRIFETSGSEIVAGMRYIGDLEERVHQLRANACVAKRVALFVDDLNDLVSAGRSMKRSVGILDMIWPSIKAQDLFLVSETSPAAYQTLERSFPGLPIVTKVIRVAPMKESEAGEVARELVEEVQPETPEPVRTEAIGEALQLARAYLAHQALPGSAVGLLKLGLARAETGGDPTPIDRVHLLGALSELTGLPRDVLDEEQTLDVQGLREKFRTRVIGQDEAVECLVERIAMLKAGLTDPQRPIGVFLFAGPTGTGKTEIAKALAELLFGSAEQMIRLDMSEFQSPDSLPRLLGSDDGDGESGSGSLVQEIRQRPFSVVLLDEFEKANRSVWDLFLQVFDDGRLTDRQGNLADFRHAIIILTSNLGATIRSEPGIGFVDTAGQFYTREVMKAVNDTFRREFINRLDHVVVFRPLSRDVMRRILRKELDDALSRRGFQSKAWAVEWEDSAIEFLLAKGFTPDLGARPLRRAIERHLLSPLAVTIVENRAPGGEQFLFVRSKESELEVEFVDPDAGPEAETRIESDGAPGPLSVRGLMVRSKGTLAEKSFLVDRVDEIVSRLSGSPWRAAKDEALAEVNRDGFWDREDRFEVVDRVELMDRIEAAGATVESLGERLRRSGPGTSLITRVAEKLYTLEAGLDDLDHGRPGMAYLGVRLLREDADFAGAGDFLAQVEEMYRRWAERRRMKWAELSPAAWTQRRGPSTPSSALGAMRFYRPRADFTCSSRPGTSPGSTGSASGSR